MKSDNKEGAGYQTRHQTEFVNTLPGGELKITKTVSGNAGDKKEEFKFTIVLTDDNGNLLQEYEYYGGVTENSMLEGVTAHENDILRLTEDENGGWKGKITLAHGQQIVIPGLPAGTRYQVKEINQEESDVPLSALSRTGDARYAGLLAALFGTAGVGTLLTALGMKKRREEYK